MKVRISTQQLGVAILFFGIVLRLIVFYQNRSLFIDESSLARNILEKDFVSFFGVLDYDQYAPPLFLCITKCFTYLLGANEWALRAWPLIAGCVSLWLIWAISRQLQLTNLALLIPISWMALSFLFVRYSTEVKQYSSDAMMSLLLLYWLLHRNFSLISGKTAEVLPSSFFVGWLMLGMLSPWLSMSSVFVLFSIGCVVGMAIWRGGHAKSILGWGLVLGAWLLSFAAYYWLILRIDLGKEALVNYHSQFFFPSHLLEGAAWQQIGQLLKSILRSSFGFTFIAYLLGSCGLLLGLYQLSRQSSRLAVLLALPILSCWGASAFGYYSLIPRLTLFFIPLLFLIFAFAWQSLEGRFILVRGKKIAASYLLLLPFFMLLPLQKGYEVLWKPLKIEELRPLLVHLASEIETNTAIYVDHEAKPAFRFYQDLHEDSPYLTNTDIYVANWDEYPAAWLDRLPPQVEEVWLVYSHLISQYAKEKMLRDIAGIPADWQAGQRITEEGATTQQYLRKNE